MKKLEYVNNWGHDEYTIDGKEVKDLRRVQIGGDVFEVLSRDITKSVQDMGTTYDAKSRHYFVKAKVGRVEVPVDLNKIAPLTNVFATDYEIDDSCPHCGKSTLDIHAK